MHFSYRSALSRPLALTVLAALGALIAGPAARAGVPFVTDDPGTVDKGHYEIDIANQFTHTHDENSGVIVGVEVDYGVTEHLELDVFVPLSFDHSFGERSHVGPGDIQVSVKYRFLDADDDGWRPSIAVAPTLIAPSGNADHDLGTGHTHGFLPVLIGKEFGKWNAFGSAGYNINPGPNNRDWWFTGAGLTRDINESWTLGGEVYYASAQEKDKKGGAGFNVGGIYNINDTYHLLLSVGRNFTNARQLNLITYYAGIQLTF